MYYFNKFLKTTLISKKLKLKKIHLNIFIKTIVTPTWEHPFLLSFIRIINS